MNFSTVRKNTPYSPNDDDNPTVRKNLVLDCINKEDKELLGGSFPYSGGNYQFIIQKVMCPIRMRIEEPDTDIEPEPNTQFEFKKPKIDISDSELEQLKLDNSPGC